MNQLQKLETFYQMMQWCKKQAKLLKLPEIRLMKIEKSVDPDAFTAHMQIMVHQPLDYIQITI